MLDVVLEGRNISEVRFFIRLSILVVLDVVLEEFVTLTFTEENLTFNPCCAGCSSGRGAHQIAIDINTTFNPCCAGCSSGRHLGLLELVAVFFTFNPCCAGCSSGRVAACKRNRNG